MENGSICKNDEFRKLNPNAKCFMPIKITNFCFNPSCIANFQNTSCKTDPMNGSTASPYFFVLILSVFIIYAMIISENLSFITEPNYANRTIIPESNLSMEHKSDSSSAILQGIRSQNSTKIIMAHINLNSIRNKFDMLSYLVAGKIDILIISESKLDSSFPSAQFYMPGFSPPYRIDRNKFGGGILMYIREDIPSKELIDHPSYGKIECIFVEINLHRKKWIIGGIYNPNKNTIGSHLTELNNSMMKFMQNYDNFVLLGDFNSEENDQEMQEFLHCFSIKNLVKEPTCFKNVQKPTCIDLILTNRKSMFQHTKVVETGLSDFHKMTVTVLKTSFKKSPPKCITYRDLKKFNRLEFENELYSVLFSYDIFKMSNDFFTSIFMQIYSKFAPLKHKYIRANEGPFMTTALRKAIMVRSKLKNIWHSKKSEISKSAYTTQRNLCTKLLRQAKRDYFNKLDPKLISDNKRFWRVVKPFFSEKSQKSQSITLVENKQIIDNDNLISETFNNFFSNIVENLDIVDNFSSNLNKDEDPIVNAINKYENHPSIKKIKENMPNESFSFQYTTINCVYKEIRLLNPSKACPKEAIPPFLIQENCDLFAVKIEADFNITVDSCTFPSNQRNSGVTPVYKKGDRTDKSNYRPISILPAVSKIFEKLLFHQMNSYMENKLSKFLCGFRKKYNTQYCLIMMLEKWKKSTDKRGQSGVLLTDLSKAFDCLNHDLLIAKLRAYGFDNNSLYLIHNYLTNRFQRVRINSNYSSWSEILTGVPQGSILGPLIFNIYLNDFFFFCEGSDIANFADDNSPYAVGDDIESVISQLEYDAKLLLQWVCDNALKANPDKFHLVTSVSSENICIYADNYEIKNSTYEKLLGVTIDNAMSFEKHVSTLCKKASQKLHALIRVSHYMTKKQRRIIMNAFITSQFGYCPLVWMFHSRSANNKINKIHERALRAIYDDYSSSFSQLLCKDKSVTIHERNIQTLAVEIYKVVNGSATELMKDVFQLKVNTRYPSKFPFQTRNVRTVRYGTETLTFMGPKIWHLVPADIKNASSLVEFKNKIKAWKPIECPCRICKIYVAKVGFVN